MNYKSFSINTPADVRPWGARETQAWKDIIDTVVMDCVQQVNNVTGHKHYRLFDPNAVDRLTITNNAQVYLSAPECAHGMTFHYPTTVFGVIEPIGYTPGVGGDFGLRITGLGTTKGDHGLEVVGILGDSNPDDDIAAIRFSARKKSGIATQAIAAIETAFDFANFNSIMVTITGAPVIGIGTQTFDASAVNYIAIKNGTFPSTHTGDQIYIGSADTPSNLASLSFYTEEPVRVGALVSDEYITIYWNGVKKAILLNSFPS